MSETENGNTAPLEPKKRKGSRLDRGFPMGKILLIILGFVFFFQIISAWKIINLEKEKTVFESEKQSFKSITEKIPKLQSEIGDLMVKQQELLGKITDSMKRYGEIQNSLDRDAKKSKDLKLDIESENNRLEATSKLRQKADTARVQALKETDGLSNEIIKLVSRKKKLQSEENVLNDSIRVLREEELEYKTKIDLLIKEATERKVRLSTRADELQKLQGSNSELSKVLSKLTTVSNDAEIAVKNLDSASSEVVVSAQEFRESQSVANNRVNQAINNLNNQISEHKDMSTGYSTKVGVAIDSLNENVKQLSIETNSLDGFAKKVEDEMENLKLRHKSAVEIQLKVKNLLVQIDKNSKDLSSGSSGLLAVLQNVRLDAESSVKRLNIATNNIENNSNIFNAKISRIDDSSLKLNSLISDIKFIYRELEETKQKQIGLVGNLQNLADGTEQALDQLKEDLSNAIESVNGFMSNIQGIEKEIESPNIDIKKLNNKEME